MKYFCFVSTCQFIFVQFFGFFGELHGCDDSLLVPDVKIALIISPKYHLHLHLKLIQRVLANQYLPVWAMEEHIASKCEKKFGTELKLLHKVMKQLGTFTFYQDPVMNSAVVYFHRRQQFDGMIDTRYLIQGLSIDKIHRAAKSVILLGTNGIIRRPQSINHPSAILTSNQDNVQVDESKYEIRETYRNRLFDSYPEILVIVSCELAEKLVENAGESNNYVTIVSYVLTLFNGVDMLYSKLKETNIKLNIAGIIIATECKSSGFVKECYGKPLNETHDYSAMIQDECIIRKIHKYVLSHKNEIPTDSYDLVVLLTINYLFNMVDGEGLEGIASYTPVYNIKKSGGLPILIAAVCEDGSFKNYATVSHELAHLMKVDHDLMSAMEEGECCGKIMKVEGSFWCKQCLSWSDESEKAFRTFFSSADCCGFINIPRSIYPPMPREMVTADELCQCYGYKSTVSFSESMDKYCNSLLLCKDESGEIHETVFPPDGTPCEINKVCWRRACV